MSTHLGYDKHDPIGRNHGNSRNGVRSKTVLTEIGPVEIDVPRDTDASFQPQIVKKRQRRLTGVDEIVLSLTARGLTTGEMSAHFAEVYGASMSKDTISKITDRWSRRCPPVNRPLDPVYPVIFVDAIMVKVRDGQVRNKPIYVVVGVTVPGERDILGLWAGDGGEGAKFWLQALTALKNRGVPDVCIAVCDRLQTPSRHHHHRVGVHGGSAVHHPPPAQHVPILRRGSTGTRSPTTCDRSTPPPPKPRRWPGSRSSKRSGASRTRRSASCGATPGQSSCRSWTTTSRSAGSSARPTRSRALTPATAARSGPADTSPRPGRAEVLVPGHPIAGPDRPRQGTMDDEVETRFQRVRHHLRGPDPPGRKLTMDQIRSTVRLTLPRLLPRAPLGFVLLEVAEIPDRLSGR